MKKILVLLLSAVLVTSGLSTIVLAEKTEEVTEAVEAAEEISEEAAHASSEEAEVVVTEETAQEATEAAAEAATEATEETEADEAAPEEEAEETAEAAAEEDPGTPVQVSTAYGDVIGLEKDGVQVFYGVPYGAVPAGDLRWQAPADPESWDEPLDCTQVHEVAMQYSTDSDTGITSAIGTEDCLNLAVYTTPSAENLPVLVYIHGGNNQSGNTEEVMGTQIVTRDDCVYVSLSYRLGLLGFNCLPALLTEEGSTGNFTLLDISKALGWIKENIAAFGGDPENITVSGFSAGGRDVMAMLISPLFEGQFQKAIAFSGGMTTADLEMSQNQIASFLAPLAVEDGKADDEDSAREWLLKPDEEVREYLYSIESERLASLVGNASIRMAAFPHLYEDDIVLPKEGFDTENYNSVPVMMLTGSTEFSFFNNFDGSYFAPDWMAFDEETQAAGNAFGNRYGSDMYRIFNTQMSAEAMYDKYDAPIYECQVNYGSDESAYPIDMFGSFHGIFVPMLSDINGYGFYDFSEPGYQDMGAKYNAYLRNFLYTGDPNGEGLEEWPAWEPEAKSTQIFDAVDGAASVTTENVFKTYDEIMDEMDADDSIPDDAKAYVIANSMRGRWFSDALDNRYGNESLWK